MLQPLDENFQPTLKSKICAFQKRTGADFRAEKKTKDLNLILIRAKERNEDNEEEEKETQ